MKINNLPSLNGNWIDLLLIVILVVYLIEGFRKGFLVEIIDLAGFLISFFGSLRFYGEAAVFLVNNFSLSRGIANALGFLLAGLILEILFSIFVRIFYSIAPKGMVYSLPAKILGLIPAFFNWLIFTAFLLTLFVVLPLRGGVKQAILTSRIAAPILAQTQSVENRLKNVFGGAINETLTFLTVEPKGNESVDLHYTVSAGELKIDSAAEEKMLDLVNLERTSRGLSSLSMDSQLQELARTYSREMFIKGYFSHYTPEGLSPFDRMQNAGITFNAAGENLALAPNVDLAHTGLMNSPGHRANILSTDFHKVGIGVIDGGVYGEMFTQEFTD